MKELSWAMFIKKQWINSLYIVDINLSTLEIVDFEI